MKEAWPVFRLWLEDKADMASMTGDVTQRSDCLSIDEVADMNDALDAWKDAERRIHERSAAREDADDD